MGVEGKKAGIPKVCLRACFQIYFLYADFLFGANQIFLATIFKRPLPHQKHLHSYT